jgi:hypothetical protein
MTNDEIVATCKAHREKNGLLDISQIAYKDKYWCELYCGGYNSCPLSIKNPPASTPKKLKEECAHKKVCRWHHDFYSALLGILPTVNMGEEKEINDQIKTISENFCLLCKYKTVN